MGIQDPYKPPFGICHLLSIPCRSHQYKTKRDQGKCHRSYIHRYIQHAVLDWGIPRNNTQKVKILDSKSCSVTYIYIYDYICRKGHPDSATCPTQERGLRHVPRHARTWLRHASWLRRASPRNVLLKKLRFLAGDLASAPPSSVPETAPSSAPEETMGSEDQGRVWSSQWFA